MSFSRFVWLLKNKALWMIKISELDDQWEGWYTEQEEERAVKHEEDVITRLFGGVRVDHLNLPSHRKSVIERFRSDIRGPRSRIFVNCWTASDDESHAMWSLYCGAKEGVAIRTSLTKAPGIGCWDDG